MLLKGGSDSRSGFALQGYQDSKFTEGVDYSEDVARTNLLARQIHQQINHPFKPRPWRRWNKVPAPPPCAAVSRTLQLASKTGCYILFTRTFQVRPPVCRTEQLIHFDGPHMLVGEVHFLQQQEPGCW